MPTRAERYRDKAKQCQTLAAAITHDSSRKQLSEAAQQWLELAEQVELLDRLGSTSGDE